MTKGLIDIITMGCSKNLIDSERLIRRIESKGYKAEHDAENPSGEYVVVNTCGFISDAKEESINLILNLIELKKEKRIGKLIVMGCLSERYRKDLLAEIPEIDILYGKYDWTDFLNRLPDLTAPSKTPKDWERKLTTPPWSAYVKISEGCDRFCSYCAIPLITGRHTSRKMEEILEEVSNLVSSGVKEFNIIAQDLSSYGLDLYKEHKLPELIDRMAKIPGVEWIRLHYLYPTDFPVGILDVINSNENVCRYLDIALQHISDNVLSAMNRKTSKRETLELLKLIREKVPGIHLRTTLMTGFPGEGEREFEELLDFVKTQRFERLGGFAYCEEDDTMAAKTLEDNVDPQEKQERLSQVMEIQQEISRSLNDSKIGSVLKVLVEEVSEDEVIGRTEFDSPEVDQEVVVKGSDALPGDFINVRITEADDFTLYGQQI